MHQHTNTTLRRTNGNLETHHQRIARLRTRQVRGADILDTHGEVKASTRNKINKLVAVMPSAVTELRYA
jgi:hypothetical protein